MAFTVLDKAAHTIKLIWISVKTDDFFPKMPSARPPLFIESESVAHQALPLSFQIN